MGRSLIQPVPLVIPKRRIAGGAYRTYLTVPSKTMYARLTEEACSANTVGNESPFFLTYVIALFTLITFKVLVAGGGL